MGILDGSGAEGSNYSPKRRKTSQVLFCPKPVRRVLVQWIGTDTTRGSGCRPFWTVLWPFPHCRSTDSQAAGCADAKLQGSILGAPSSPGLGASWALGATSGLQSPAGPCLGFPSWCCGWRELGSPRLVLFPTSQGPLSVLVSATLCTPPASFGGSRQKGQCGPCPSVLAGSARFRPVSPVPVPSLV